jgi:hypothetical protein
VFDESWFGGVPAVGQLSDEEKVACRTLVDSAKLRLGSYVLAQAPAEVDGRPWSWNDYVYDQGRNAIVSARDPAALIPFNYVAVGIAPLHG